MYTLWAKRGSLRKIMANGGVLELVITAGSYIQVFTFVAMCSVAEFNLGLCHGL